MKPYNPAAAVIATWSVIDCYLNVHYRPYQPAVAFNINLMWEMGTCTPRLPFKAQHGSVRRTITSTIIKRKIRCMAYVLLSKSMHRQLSHFAAISSYRLNGCCRCSTSLIVHCSLPRVDYLRGCGSSRLLISRANLTSVPGEKALKSFHSGLLKSRHFVGAFRFFREKYNQ